MQLLRYLLTFTLLLLSIPSFATHLADDIEPGDNINEITLPLTKESAAELVRYTSKGKILSVKEQQYKGKKIFKIKVLHNNGKIKNYRLNPLTGHPPQ